MVYLLFIPMIAVGGYFAFRYFSIKHALRDANLELQEILGAYQKSDSPSFHAR